MRHIASRLAAIVCITVACAGCQKSDDNPTDPDPEPRSNLKTVATFTQAEVLDAFNAFYAEWNKTSTLPSTLSVSGKSLNQPQYQWALCSLICDIADGKTSDIEVLNCKAADHPDNDSYDSDSIPVTGEESLVSVATQILAGVRLNGQIPSQVTFERDGATVAFSTNRATVSLSRTASEYKSTGALPEVISTEYIGEEKGGDEDIDDGKGDGEDEGGEDIDKGDGEDGGDAEVDKPSEDATILDFAKEYVKLLDVWEKTTGKINMLTGESRKGADVDFDVNDAHYIPSATTITVGGATFSTADIFETALRSYLLVRGYDGNNTTKYGKNSIPKLSGYSPMSTTKLPETHSYKWGDSPYNETRSNGGHLMLDTFGGGYDWGGGYVPCQVRLDFLDNFAMRNANYPMGRSLTISNMSSYQSDQLEGYRGCASSMRGLITYAFFFKYLLDNNLDDASQIKEDKIFRSELFGDEE